MTFCKQNPIVPTANHDLGILMMQQGKVKLSLPHLRAALEGNPEKGQYWLSYAENLLVTREALGALRFCNRRNSADFRNSQ